MRVRTCPRVPVTINGFHMREMGILDTGAGPGLFISLDHLDKLFPGETAQAVSLRINRVSGRVLGLDGQPLSVVGSIWVNLEVEGKKIRCPLLICPNMKVTEGPLIGCWAMYRLGYKLISPQNKDVLQEADYNDNYLWDEERFPTPNQSGEKRPWRPRDLWPYVYRDRPSGTNSDDARSITPPPPIPPPHRPAH